MDIKIILLFRSISFAMVLVTLLKSQRKKCDKFPFNQLISGLIVFLLCASIFNISNFNINDFNKKSKNKISTEIKHILYAENSAQRIEDRIIEYLDGYDGELDLKNVQVDLEVVDGGTAFSINVYYNIEWYHIYSTKQLYFFKIL